MTYRSDRDDGFVAGEVDVEAAEPHLRLRNQTRTSERWPLDYTVALTPTYPNLGGVRWWFLCPETGRRVAKLYLPIGSLRFLSREAHGLVHDTRQMCSCDRLSYGITRIAAQLGAPDHDFAEPPEKPPRMRWHTYDRLVDRWYDARAQFWAALERRAAG
jgi:hypothetical protein